ncbi:MAG: sel1 repeat family protein [Clostridia bacterium]|nr:sel1 repeat family protein [Clostridia bacterium]
MITNDMISQVTGIVRRTNLDKMRACYVEYSTDFDGRTECRDYEAKIKNAQGKMRNLAWTKEIYTLRDTRLSAAAQKYYTLKSVLDGMVKESDAIVASDLAARQARARSIDAEYDQYSGVLSNERIADARVFVRNYHATPADVLIFCQKATSSEIRRFETRLDQNFKDNGHKAAAYELDKKFAALSPIQRNHAYFTTADATIAQIQRTPSDIKNFCTVATIGAINKFVSDINTEKKYLECEERIDRLARNKEQTVAWCEKVWAEYKSLSQNIDKYRNAGLLRDLNYDANKLYDGFKEKARSIDNEYARYAGSLSNDQISQARAFVKSYYATPQFITAICQKATGPEIRNFETRLDRNLKDNGLRAKAAELDTRFRELFPIKRDRSYFALVESVISQINAAPSDARAYCTAATNSAIIKLSNDINTEKKYLECEELIDRIAAGKTRTVAWCERVWKEYKSLSANIAQYRNAQKLRDLNDDATKLYTEITCEPYTNALNGRVSFKEIISLDEGLKTFKEKDILKKGIPSFDDKWKKKVAEAWADARKQATEYYKQAKTYYNQKQYDKAFRLFLDAEKYGEPDAYYMLGEHYYYGYGVAQNRTKACDYYNLAAERGDTSAMVDLGIIYESSHPDTSFKWRRRAIAAGDNRPALDLAKMYFDGKGTSRNYNEAKTLFEKVAKDGNAEANAYLGYIHENGLSVPKNEQLAVEYYKKGLSIDWAKKAHDKLFHKLDEERRDNEIEEQLALAKRGDPNAQRFIGECYYNGYRTTQSYEMAFEWFKKAAAHGNGRAMSLLGDMYMNGYGVKQDLKKAKKYYQDAIKHGEK